jgi:hypothetical protein
MKGFVTGCKCVETGEHFIEIRLAEIEQLIYESDPVVQTDLDAIAYESVI